MQHASNLVALINPNKLHPGIPPYALDILTTSLEQEGFMVEVVDLTFQRELWREALGDYFRTKSPLLVGVTIRNTDTIYPQEQRVFLPEHHEIIDEIRRLTRAPLVGGGVGFSSMPFALVEYFGLDFGVKGPGELVLTQLAGAFARGDPATGVAGLIINTPRGAEQVPWVPGPAPIARRHQAPNQATIVNRQTPYLRRSDSAFKVDNRRYYELGGLGNILTKNGCPFRCAHCVEPDAKGARFSRREVRSVVAELEALAAQGVLDVHSTDSEVNLAFSHIKDILREIIERKRTNAGTPLHRLRIWLYCQPTPFDEEFASLLAQAGVKGINFGSDHTCKELIEGWKVTANGRPFYTYEDIQRANQLAKQYDLLVMHDILLGMPGETLATLYRCLDETMALDATVIGYTLGIRVFPYSPLGIRFAAESDGERTIRGLQSNTATRPILLRPLERCDSIAAYERQFMFEASGALRPLYFFSPDLPEDAATLASPSGRWTRTLELMRAHVPERDHGRAMLPTVPGNAANDNNYADNPFLVLQAKLGYKGAFWSRWRQRDQIMAEGAQKGLAFTPSPRAREAGEPAAAHLASLPGAAITSSSIAIGKAALASGRLLQDRLELTWKSGEQSDFHLIWLRDNCPTGLAWIEGIRTRVHQVVDLPERPSVEAFSVGPDVLQVRWTDSPAESRYDAGWLFAHRYDRPRLFDRPPRHLWDASLGRFPELELPSVDADDGQAMLDALVTVGAVCVRGGLAEPGFSTQFVSRFGTVIETSFGKTWQVRLNPETDPVTREYDYKELALHTDFTFARFASFVEFLHCVRADRAGGASTLADGFQIAEDLRAEAPGAFELLSAWPVAYQVLTRKHDMRTSRPIISLGKDGAIDMIAAADRMMVPLGLPPEVVVPFYDALRAWESRLMSPRYQLEIDLKPGDLLMWDNGRVLHGRRGLSRAHGDERLLEGGYLHLDEIESQWRMKTARQGGN